MKKKMLKIILLIALICAVTNIAYAKWTETKYLKGETQIKNPIILLSSSGEANIEISKDVGTYETSFSVRNFDTDITNVSEVAFGYTITITVSDLNFPIKYQLINTVTGETIELNENLETGTILIGTEATIHDYKIIATWNELDTTTEVAESVNVGVKINARQVEGI